MHFLKGVADDIDAVVSSKADIVKLYNEHTRTVKTARRQLSDMTAVFGFKLEDAIATLIFSRPNEPKNFIAGWVHQAKVMILKSENTIQKIVFSMISASEVARQSIPIPSDDDLRAWAGDVWSKETKLEDLQKIDAAVSQATKILAGHVVTMREEIMKIKDAKIDDKLDRIFVCNAGWCWEDLPAGDWSLPSDEEEDSEDEDDDATVYYEKCNGRRSRKESLEGKKSLEGEESLEGKKSLEGEESLEGKESLEGEKSLEGKGSLEGSGSIGILECNFFN
ncbi:hypothetical protein B0T21DRAFT_350928 [Apiosordaria backusii]|uniref:Uncharacterized protein n=1 Tax=Apiosordaria backusii TaxID=314023 RepID=A0AA40E1P4_9PEZI|nr:hypothetical protein B0T21DRAFT_350928 [Apiosordaria backusii]